MKHLQPSRAQPLYRSVAERVAQHIRSSALGPGTQLPTEEEIADRFDSAVSTVREALVALELRGCVELRFGRGVFVASPRMYATLDAAGADLFGETESPVFGEAGPFELLEARMLVEPECAALAARHASEKQIDAIEQRYRLMALEYANASFGLMAPREFHEAIATASGNWTLASVVSHIWNLTDSSRLYRRLDRHLIGEFSGNSTVLECGRIFSAIANQDSIGAHHAMEVHLLGTIARLSVNLSERHQFLRPMPRH